MKNVSRKLSGFLNYVSGYFTSLPGIGLLLVIFISMVELVCSYHIYGYSSDDVVWQTSLLTWKPFSGQNYITDDGASYIAKVPLFWIVGHILSPGRPALFLTSAVMTIVGVVTVYYCYLYIIRVLKIKLSWKSLLPFLWSISVGYALYRIFLSPNMHNLEAAAIVLLITFTIALYQTKKEILLRSVKTLVCIVVAALFIGLMIVNDHYFLYFGLLPAIILAAFYHIGQKNTFKKLPISASVLVLSFLCAALIKKLVEWSGVIFEKSAGSDVPNTVAAALLPDKTASTFDGLFTMFGANIFSRGVESILFIAALVNLIVLIIIIITNARFFTEAIALFLKRRGNNKERIAFLGITLPFWLLIIFYLLADMPSPYRYYILLPFLGAIGLALFINRLSYKPWIIALVTVSLIINVSLSMLSVHNPTRYASTPYYPGDATSTSYVQQLVSTLQQNNLTKGYGNYWDGNITTYMSKGSIQLLPVVCADGGVTSHLRWLYNQSVENIPASSSFYISNPVYSSFIPCSPKDLERQFGSPTKTIPFHTATIYVYGYDISQRMAK